MWNGLGFPLHGDSRHVVRVSFVSNPHRTAGQVECLLVLIESLREGQGIQRLIRLHAQRGLEDQRVFARETQVGILRDIASSHDVVRRTVPSGVLRSAALLSAATG